ncbi:hypothetical protein GT755_36300 [Herbidospora sp. NEAU-GS84]|uniref:Uncharacterized protein n=1 Tax=Herbidospora solisilvae TaxID=2696284 RepID=A0A7C9P320_9ACTN|nr:hypothetical protein [Herbidospora solisilvae]NAS27117.1 hypothetical protein [Herbidospora solisilvae]
MYDDGLVICTDTELIIRTYYLWGGDKSISLRAIRAVNAVPLPHGSRRLWGTGDFVHWYNLDRDRPRRRMALWIDVGARIVPSITPRDPGRLITELASRGIRTNRAGMVQRGQGWMRLA